MKKYTVFIRQLNNEGTTFISSYETPGVPEAIDLARADCAECWEADEKDLHVLGVAAGDVEILEWDDLV
jgi:hypothetical protein